MRDISRHPATIDDLLARDEDERLELIRGNLVPKAAPSAEHAHAQSGVDRQVAWRFVGVPHYWLVDPIEGTLEVFRRTELAYALVLSAHRGQRIRPEPFEAAEFSVDELLGGDPEDVAE